MADDGGCCCGVGIRAVQLSIAEAGVRVSASLVGWDKEERTGLECWIGGSDGTVACRADI